MKKAILFLCFFVNIVEINSCNLCWGYPNNSGTGKRLTQAPIEPLKDCSCQCWKYPHTQGSNDPYVCVACNHRLMPEEVVTTPLQQYPRYVTQRVTNKQQS